LPRLLVRPGPEGKYFGRLCEEELSPWFEQREFETVDALRSDTMVAWRRAGFFAEFQYWPEDQPDFPVMAGIGLIRDMPFGFFGPRKPMRHGLGLWEVVTDDSSRSVLRETFRNENQLRRLLGKIRDRALPFAEPYFADRKAMEAAIKDRKRVR
jgi:hypothetical protein